MAASLLLCACNQITINGSYDIIPAPKEIQLAGDETFSFNAKTKIYYPAGNEDLHRNAEFLSDYINDMVQFRLEVCEIQGEVNDGICLLTVPGYFAEPESYEIKVMPKQIIVTGEDAAGVFYGIQALRKSLPVVRVEAGNFVRIKLGE